jgi:hypothetical protein
MKKRTIIFLIIGLSLALAKQWPIKTREREIERDYDYTVGGYDGDYETGYNEGWRDRRYRRGPVEATAEGTGDVVETTAEVPGTVLHGIFGGPDDDYWERRRQRREDREDRRSSRRERKQNRRNRNND